jgi:hypothetical protein
VALQSRLEDRSLEMGAFGAPGGGIVQEGGVARSDRD